MSVDSINHNNSAVTVVGVFDQSPAAEQAYNELRSAGFNPESVSLLYKTSPSSLMPAKTSEDSEETRPLFLGVIIGGSLGAITGWLLAGGSTLFPGFGPLVELGTLPVIILGSLLGILCSILISSNRSQPVNGYSKFNEHASSGRVKISVITSNSMMFSQAREIIKRNGAYGTRYLKS